ncbi:hypothetical protein BDN71DRAFT_1501076 [Pleurotus eryngii]|uniref:Uncharacterized protein n=1 Tax=Pleurotus eryngii TaxID=5323 RepID=A0A9P6DDY8_PLEER|nr:hypothetical protein BDN71DRAFT_1501076 [Pleurotus eryngii]
MVSLLGIVSLLSTLHLKRLESNNWTVSDSDASDLLPILLACQRTLRELTLEIIGVRRQDNPQQARSESRPSSPVVCFDALRPLTLSQNMKSLPNTVDPSECFSSHPDVLPDVPLPNLGTTICPSELTTIMIDAKAVEYLDTMTWIQECPTKFRIPVVFSRLLFNYEPPYCALQRLHGHGDLKRIDFNIINDRGEVSTFKEVFAEILEEISAEVEGARIDLHMRSV